MIFSFYAAFFTLFVFFGSCEWDGQRPFYIIGHMANDIGLITPYLDKGANAIEADIQFNQDGSVKEVFHGFPCDCFRICTHRADLKEFLNYMRNITDPCVPGNYGGRLVMQFFDLKLSGSGNLKVSGRAMAAHILDYLWTKDRCRKQEVRALLYIGSYKYADFIPAFIKEFFRRGVESRLKDIGFDAGQDGQDHLEENRRIIAKLGIHSHIWQGEGHTNCYSAVLPDTKLKEAVAIRDSKNGYIQKVYHWTIDLKHRMRLSLDIGVDGMITNYPGALLEVLKEPRYRDKFRPATPKDNPFTRYYGEKHCVHCTEPSKYY